MANATTETDESRLPSMKQRLRLGFLLLSILPLISCVIAMLTIDRMADLQDSWIDSYRIQQQAQQQAQMQQLGMEKLARHWPSLSPRERQVWLTELGERQQQLTDSLEDPKAKGLADELLRSLKSLDPQAIEAFSLPGMAEASRDLGVRIGKLSQSQLDKQQHDAALDRWKLKLILAGFTLLLLLISQTLAWFILGRHFVRPLLQLRRRLNLLSQQRPILAGLTPVNREVQQMDEQLSRLQQRLGQETGLAQKDAITGLHNRSALNQHLQQQWLRALRHGDNLSLLLLSPDKLQQYDGTPLGPLPHPSFIRVIQLLELHCNRADDFLAHVRDDTLALVLSGTDLEQAVKQAQKLCQLTLSADIPAPLKASNPRITLSVGIASQVPRSAHAWDSLLQDAEAALVQARAQGGNQALVAPCALPDRQAPIAQVS
ncbi:GGDEF domain-containing protein [Shewanella cyperi]|uniref:diguanylate cyclase n=1 Tax=Shewanella cyperi TaxID=2814292 RepID=A0A974XPN5_9GAMM|nr:GGDEF domain-containing protein [Shewanella cyperi]QSX31103.1 GGDEF domain-containing protein [Shewanella cyperi]